VCENTETCDEIFFCFYSFVHCHYQHQAMASLNLNNTEMINNDGSANGTFENRSIFTILFLIISLVGPSVGCTIFLLLHFGRIHFRH